MLSLDAAMAGCSANESADRCVAQIVQALDLSGDEALNRAELSRALRAGTLFAAGLTEDWTPNSDGVIAQLAAAPTAPLLAMMLLGSFDYSGDGALDAVEISADRFTNLPTTALSNALPDEAALNALLEQQLMTLLPLFMAITE